MALRETDDISAGAAGSRDAAKNDGRAEARALVKQMNGAQRAATVIIAVGDDRAGKLFSSMNDDEIKEISTAMSTLGSIKATVVEEVFRNFVSTFSGAGSLTGNLTGTERLLSRFIDGDRLEGIMEGVRGPAGRTMWEKLANVDANILATYLKNEHPQTVAVILGKIRPDHAAHVLACFVEDFGNDVVSRMIGAEPVKKEILARIETTLRVELMATLVRTSKQNNRELLAGIFNHFDRNHEGRFMGALQERNGESAEKVRAFMFTFADLARVDPAGVQVLIRAINKDDLSMALKGASAETLELFFGNMTARAAGILRDDMEAMGAVRLRDVEKAQATVLLVARTLADKGEIIIADGSAADEIIY